jgi:hypothetical protein
MLPGIGAVAADDVVKPDAQARYGPGDQQPGPPARRGVAAAGRELPGQALFLLRHPGQR